MSLIVPRLAAPCLPTRPDARRFLYLPDGIHACAQANGTGRLGLLSEAFPQAGLEFALRRALDDGKPRCCAAANVGVRRMFVEPGLGELLGVQLVQGAPEVRPNAVVCVSASWAVLAFAFHREASYGHAQHTNQDRT